MNAARPCLDCRLATRSITGRCGPCQRTRDRQRNARRAGYYDTIHRRRSEHARRCQPWCSICGTTADLTFDHEHNQVECRSCNSSHRRNPA